MAYSEAFVRAAEACGRQFGAPIPQELLTIGEPDGLGWAMKFNPTDGELGGVPPFTAIAYWNGWPAGIIEPSGGVIAAGDAANERSFIEWCESIPERSHA